MRTGNPYTLWPSGVGWVVGGLSATPAEIARDFGFKFITIPDDPSPVEVVAICDEAIGQFLLRHDLGGPSNGTDVEVDADVTRAAGLAAVRRQLRLERDAFEWITDQERWPYVTPLMAEARATKSRTPKPA